MTDERKIFSDEDWKDQAEREKQRLAEKLDKDDAKEGTRAMPEASFPTFLAGLAAEAYMALGELENPVRKETLFDPVHAKYVIDLLQVIRQKTQGNLTQQEESDLDAILYDCRMRFVARSKKPAQE